MFEENKKEISAGILVYRLGKDGKIQVLLGKNGRT